MYSERGQANRLQHSTSGDGDGQAGHVASAGYEPARRLRAGNSSGTAERKRERFLGLRRS